MTSVDDIERRFGRNLGRVDGLVEVFGVDGATRNDDILRAAVVLLHAALEELLRSSVGLLLPSAAPKSYEKMMFVPCGSPEGKSEKLDLPQLAEYRGQTVDAVLDRAIEFHLEHSNYNNTTEVIGTLERLGLAKRPSATTLAGLAAMMRRRHWIVHRADTGHGQHEAQALAKDTVVAWLGCVRQFGEPLLAELLVVRARRTL